MRDGTRVVVKPAPKSVTFEDRVRNAKASMDKLGLTDDVLKRMQRRIAWKGQMYKPYGA
jgi:hypothetical protein